VSIPTTAAEAAAILRDLARGREDGDGADVWPLYDRAEDAMAAVVALDLAATRLESERAAERARAVAAEAECARLTTERDAARRAATFAEMERDTLRGLTDAMREDNVRLRAIVAGRETAPTDAELTTHHDEGGQWLVIRAASPRSIVDTLRSVTDVRAWARSGTPLRWLPLDASGRPCPWPTPALDAAREGR
jgi:hypothetical protein